jgi:hypothetical protein
MIDAPKRQLLSDQIVGSRVVMIADAGHSAQWEKPSAFARVINSFAITEPKSDAKQKTKAQLADDSFVIVGFVLVSAVGLTSALSRAGRQKVTIVDGEDVAFARTRDEGTAEDI